MTEDEIHHSEAEVVAVDRAVATYRRAVRGELRCVVARPQDVVFDFLADVRNEREWNPRVVRIEMTSTGPIGAGTRFRGTYKGLGTLETELVLSERPKRLSFRSEGSRMDITGTFELSGEAGATSVALAAELAPRGPLRVAAPLMAPVLRRQNRKAGLRLKRALEQPPTSS